VKEGPLTKICRSKHEQRWVVLFNDILIYASESSIGLIKKLHFHKLFHLETLRVENVPDKETAHKKIKNAFQVVTPNKSFVLIAATPELKEEWIKVLKDTISAWCSKRATLARSQGETSFVISEAPVWIPDDEVVSCMLCFAPFTFTKRRHHCRSCGKVICAECSRKKLLLLNVDKSPVRVCDNCYNNLATSKEEEAESANKTVLASPIEQKEGSAPPSPSPRAIEYEALFNFEAENERELELKVGEHIWIVEEEVNGWYEAKSMNTGRVGFVPVNYVRRV